MRVLTVVGNRPQFIKAAAVSGPLRERAQELLVHTGQHYDDALSGTFFRELGLARPDRELGISGGSNTSQLARMLAALEPLMVQERPDAVLVYGDTNSTLAGALAAAQAQVAVVHVEAGMRSFDRSMPEELNRVLSDHLAELLLCPSDDGGGRTCGPSRSRARIEVVGDVMVDVSLRWQERARAERTALAAHGLQPGDYLLLTAHRAGNVDPPERLERLVELLEALPGPVLFPVHPRTRARLRASGLIERLAVRDGLTLTEPLGYLGVRLAADPCERRADRLGRRPEGGLPGGRAVRDPAGQHRVAGDGEQRLEHARGPRPAAALAALARRPPAEHPPLYGDGHAAERCVEAILGV